MRFAHLDEAGTSPKEPLAVVAGIVSSPDKQWRALHQYLSDMADALIPADLRDGAIFHAKDIFHGSRLFSRDRFSREQRNEILIELARIPVKFDVPVVTGFVRKDLTKWAEGTDVNASCYALAFGTCAVGVEHFMRTFTPAEEVVTIIAEDVPHMRKMAKWGYNILQDKKKDWGGHIGEKVLPLTRIVEQPLFSAKDESSILQVADLLAFVTCRRVGGNEDVHFLFEEFSQKIVNFPGWSEVQPHENLGKL